MTMTKISQLAGIALLLSCVVAATGCGVTKSADPLSPTVAGPIPGVEISAPKIIEPPNGMQVPVDKQPLTLLIENASSNGPRPLSYAFEIAIDSNFNNKVFTRGSITPTDGARTSLRLPDTLATGRTYFWRSRAEDGANSGPYSATTSFNVFTPIVIEAPPLLTPGSNASVSTLRPRVSVSNSARSGPVGPITYTIEMSLNFEFTAKVAIWNFTEQPNQSSFDVPVDLAFGTVYYWHVRGSDASTTSPWSNTLAFMTAAAPPPPPSGGGGGNGPVGDWRSCGSTPGEALVRCVHAAVNPERSEHGAFEITKRVAWLLRGSGVGLLIKNGGENVVSWQGRSFAAARICYPDGHIYKVLSDVPATNGPSWQDNDFVDRSLYLPAIDPGS
jgi:hypothetical protein